MPLRNSFQRIVIYNIFLCWLIVNCDPKWDFSTKTNIYSKKLRDHCLTLRLTPRHLWEAILNPGWIDNKSVFSSQVYIPSYNMSNANVYFDWFLNTTRIADFGASVFSLASDIISPGFLNQANTLALFSLDCEATLASAWECVCPALK